MGFSPGEFKNEQGEEMHIEGKDGGRVIFWNHDESKKYFSLSEDQAVELLLQMRTVLRVY